MRAGAEGLSSVSVQTCLHALTLLLATKLADFKEARAPKLETEGDRGMENGWGFNPRIAYARAGPESVMFRTGGILSGPRDRQVGGGGHGATANSVTLGWMEDMTFYEKLRAYGIDGTL